MSLPAVEDLGVDFLREGHLTAALFCLREAMERGTRNGEVRQSYVHAMLLLFTEAEADNLRKRLRGEPAGEALDTRETWNSLVLLSADNARDWPEDPHNHLLHGMCLARVGRYGEALAAYERGLALDPSEEEVEELKTLLRQAEEALQR
jgi:tetratricopeptide (TPR) repeat protein